MIAPMKPLFTATANCVGGRNGHSETTDGLVKADLSIPKEMGGPGMPGRTTPEHLFATGYAACFAGAVDFVGKQHKKDASKATVTCAVTVGAREPTGLALSVKMHVIDHTIATAELKQIVQEAHEKICPYSHATRDNIVVEFVVAGA